MKKIAFKKLKDGSIRIPISPVRTDASRPIYESIILPQAYSILYRPQSRRRSNGVKRIPKQETGALQIAPLFKSVALLLIFSLNWTGLFAIGQTLAYYSDTEGSSNNIFTAASLDFALSSYEYEGSIGLDETVSKSSVLLNSGGMDFQYTLGAEEISDEDDFCDALNIQAKLNGVEKYEGDLMSLATSALTALGTWKFNIELPVDEDSFTNGAECRFDIVFKGWQTNVASYGAGGFTDEERMSFIITARMVVLNEFLPRPDGVAYGFDFGNDASDMPQGEWIEIYNNSTEPIDVAGWYTRDATDGEGNKVVITALNTAPATTIIGGKSWLVIYMNKPILNNTGDTVRLFNSDNVLMDSYEYEDNDFCEIEPSPGDENSTDASGECGGVPPNKSYARIPDGIGDWVDPIPTPGRMNKIDNSSTPAIILEEAAEDSEPLPDNVIILTGDLPETQSTTTEPVTETRIPDEEITTEPITDESIPTAGEETVIPPEDTEEIVTTEDTLPTEETLLTEEPAAEEAVLPTDENNDTPADASESEAEAIIPEEENAKEPETIETTSTPEETSPAEPEDTVNELPPLIEEAIEAPEPVEIIEPPQEEPPLEPSGEDPIGEQAPNGASLTGQANI
ncbi:MAG: lamin tail domain-containing protein [Candidatus Sungbacteria bacterium]|nr:lamin tail domain-containing protein [Candidatus Sungbacteria bacterium]